MLARMLRRRTLLVDLSNNNADPIDWHALKRAGVFGALLKVSEGTTFVDDTFDRRAAAARAAGLHVGGYHFARPEGSAFTQAMLFAKHLGTVGRRDLHPALDLETNDGNLSPSVLFEWAHTFGQHVYSLTGARCLWYTYPAFLAEQRWPHPLGNGAGLWIAAYGPNDGTDHGLAGFDLSPWSRAVAHQFTSVGSIAGVNGHVDLTHARNRRAMLAHGLRGLV
jgi:GH25 family lysozyme M1 (1,4-beta-N-acetylmuramidase)